MVIPKLEATRLGCDAITAVAFHSYTAIEMMKIIGVIKMALMVMTPAAVFSCIPSDTASDTKLLGSSGSIGWDCCYSDWGFCWTLHGFSAAQVAYFHPSQHRPRTAGHGNRSSSFSSVPQGFGLDMK